MQFQNQLVWIMEITRCLHSLNKLVQLMIAETKLWKGKSHLGARYIVSHP